jgi:FeS assembly SUF system protein
MARWNRGLEPETAPRINTAGEPMTEKFENTPSRDAQTEEPKGLCQNEHPEQHERHQTEHHSLNALVIEAQVIDALETVFDPEIPVNIYELGLIYGVNVSDDGAVIVTMTLTAPGCPAAQSLPVEVENKVREIPGVTEARVDITFDPPWTMDKMSDAARLQLGFM